MKTNETIIGIIENIPSTYDGSNFVVKASTIRGENKEKCCEAAGVSEDEEFSIEGDLDPEVELKIFESGTKILQLAREESRFFPEQQLRLKI